MAKGNYQQRLKEQRQGYLDVGIDFGTQRTADYISIVLNDPEIMGKSALGASRLRKVFDAVHEMEKTFNAAFYANPEQDYWQEVLDRRLAEIFGKDNLCPFKERYPFLKEVRYGK